MFKIKNKTNNTKKFIKATEPINPTQSKLSGQVEGYRWAREHMPEYNKSSEERFKSDAMAAAKEKTNYMTYNNIEYSDEIFIRAFWYAAMELFNEML